MEYYRWEGQYVFSDASRDFEAPQESVHALTDEQVEEYTTHDLFGSDWVPIDADSVEDVETDDPGKGEDDFAALDGVGSAKADALYDDGYATFDDLREAGPDELATTDGIDASLAQSIADQLD